MKTTIDKLYPDIWHCMFEYFSTTELFHSFVNITPAANEVLLNDNSNFYFRRVRLDSNLEILPDKLSICRIRSIEIHQGTTFDIIRKCSALRSLKLIGEFDWIISLLTRVSSENISLERLILVTCSMKSLQIKIILRLAGLMRSLSQLGIYVDEIEETMQPNKLLINETRIESFTLHSSSSIGWNDVLNLLPALSNIHVLDLTLFPESKSCRFAFNFCQLHYIRLILLEVSFDSLIQVVRTTPFLTKLKLTGLIDVEGYVINQRWISLFDLCPSIDSIRIYLSLEEGKNNFRKEAILSPLHEINLKLQCLDDEYDDYLSEPSQQSWWKLSGFLKKHNALRK